jgi:hypothetical protein
MPEKRCNICGVVKPYSEFRRHRDCIGGVAARCKKCVSKYDSKYRDENRDKVLEAQRKYDRRVRGEIARGERVVSERAKAVKRKYDLVYRRDNRERLTENAREYWIKNRDTLLERKRRYYLKNREEIKKKVAIYQSDPGFRRKRNAYLRDYTRRKRREDPMYKLVENLRCRVKDAVRGRYKKSRSAIELIGCSVKVVKWFLEQQFYPDPETGEEMTWENYGTFGWHIDHIKPISYFDLSNLEEQRMAFHASNLQPLWWHENLSKGGRLV